MVDWLYKMHCERMMAMHDSLPRWARDLQNFSPLTANWDPEDIIYVGKDGIEEIVKRHDKHLIVEGVRPLYVKKKSENF